MLNSILKKVEANSSIKVVDKAWGKEYWIVNEPEYCGKLLIINEGKSGSNHCHKNKKETFFVLMGKVLLQVGSEGIKLDNTTEAVTILPGQYHRFTGISKSLILEVSTHHDDKDTYRL